mgnify:FL=1
MPTNKDKDEDKTNKGFELDGNTETTANSPDNLYSDPDYSEFSFLYQNSRLEESKVVLDKLLEKYEHNSRLLELQKDIDLQIGLKEISVKQAKSEKEKKLKRTLKRSLTIFGILLAAALLFGGVFYLSRNYLQGQQESKKQSQLLVLQDQVEQLLLSGQYDVAIDILDTMQSIDPAYAPLESLYVEANLLGELQAQYNEAKVLIDEGRIDEALIMLSEINVARPGLWDVEHLLDELQTGISISELFVQADNAYQNKDWETVIQTYKQVEQLNPEIDDTVMKEQLLNSYLQRIIQILESKSSTVEDIESAEYYYREAVTMIPQDREHESERQNLQLISSSLFELKFIQTAQQLLQDPNQTFSSISKAVSYMSKAYNLDPSNQTNKNNLDKAQLYEISYSYFYKMDWIPAIDNLEKLIEKDKNFAGGNAKLLLYEAYYARGARSFSVGLYVDAQQNLEQAEILAWEDPNNLLKLFQVQTKLAETFEKLDDFENAVAYYKYAFQKIDAYNRGLYMEEITTSISEAEYLANQRDFEGACQAYAKAVQATSLLYAEKTLLVEQGINLAILADLNQSTINAIVERNNLPQSVYVNYEQELIIPYLPK